IVLIRARITSITVNGKNAYELKGKFLDDFHNNAFSGALWDYWKLGSGEVELTNEKTFNLEETNQDDEQEIGEIFRIETNLFEYETPLCEKFKEFNYLLKIDPDVLTNDIVGFKTYSEWPTCSWKEDGYCNGGNLPGAYIVGNALCYQDLEWYNALKDSKLKDEALKNKAIIEGMIDDNDESSNNGWRRWNGYEIADHGQEEREYENEHEDEDEKRCELFDDHKLSVCTVRRFEMIKHSFGQDEEYVAVKEDEYEDSTSTSKDTCRAYQEIFRMIDERWMDLTAKKSTMLVKYLQSGNLEVLES
ncbi:hypothetical protein Tco_0914334, partial [Tanacetum coccineum]